MREIGNTVRQALALLNPRLRRPWLLQVPWSVVVCSNYSCGPDVILKQTAETFATVNRSGPNRLALK